MRVSGLVADDDAIVRGVRLQQRRVSAMTGYDRCARWGSRMNTDSWRRLSVLIVKGPLIMLSLKKVVSRRCVPVVSDGWWREGTGRGGGIKRRVDGNLRKYSCLVVSA